MFKLPLLRGCQRSSRSTLCGFLTPRPPVGAKKELSHIFDEIITIFCSVARLLPFSSRNFHIACHTDHSDHTRARRACISYSRRAFGSGHGEDHGVRNDPTGRSNHHHPENRPNRNSPSPQTVATYRIDRITIASCTRTTPSHSKAALGHALLHRL